MKKITIIFAFLTSTISSCNLLQGLAEMTNYSSVTITAVKITNFPNKKPNGFSWDPLGGKPDIYFIIGEGGVKRYVQQDVEIGSKPNWRLKKVFTTTNLNEVIPIVFKDEDDGLNVSADDFMGSISFSPILYKGRSTALLSSTQSPSVTVELTLVWK